MNTRLPIVGFAALLWATSVQAVVTARAKCQATKNRGAGKYAKCLQNAEAVLVKKKGACSATVATVCYRDEECPLGETCTKDLTKYNKAVTKCEEKFAEKWQKAIDKATEAGATCPDAPLIVDNFNVAIGTHSYNITNALNGGGLAAGASRLETGQTGCWDSAGNPISCSGTGQDGELQKGLARDYTDNGDGTITDNRTGLMWEKLDDNNANGIHDYSAMFNWVDAFKKIQVLNGDGTGCIGADNPDACCTGAGTGSCSAFAGQTDWRLPNRFELESLFDLAAWSSPAVDPAFNTNCSAGCTVDGSVPPMCSCTLSGGYWTSTTSLSTTGCGGGLYCNAYDVEFSSGAIQPNKVKSSNLFFVRAVRGGL